MCGSEGRLYLLLSGPRRQPKQYKYILILYATNTTIHVFCGLKKYRKERIINFSLPRLETLHGNTTSTVVFLLLLIILLLLVIIDIYSRKEEKTKFLKIRKFFNLFSSQTILARRTHVSRKTPSNLKSFRPHGHSSVCHRDSYIKQYIMNQPV